MPSINNSIVQSTPLCSPMDQLKMLVLLSDGVK